jgi:FAD/FMN-containing dehydrogenase
VGYAAPSLAILASRWNLASLAAAHGPTGLPGAVLYPRSTDDVVKIVKTASKYGIPLIPYCAGTSLEGQSAREVFYS